MKNIRDEFLTRILYPEWFNRSITSDKIHLCDFSIWEQFGETFEFVKEQDWNYDFYSFAKDFCSNGSKDGWWTVMTSFINPELFADALYAYLKEKRNEKI